MNIFVPQNLAPPKKPKFRLPGGIMPAAPNYMPEPVEAPARVANIRSEYEGLAVKLKPWFDEIRDNVDVVIGKQWRDSEIEYLRALKRVARTYNMVLPQIIAIDGSTIQDKLSPRGLPRGEEDAPLAEMHTDILKWALDESNYYWHLRRSISDKLWSRISWLGTFWQYTGRHQDGQPVVMRLDPFSVLFDIDNTNADINRGNMICLSRFLDVDSISGIYAHDNDELAELLDRRAMELEGPKARERRRRGVTTRFRSVSASAFQITQGMGSRDPNEVGAVSTDYFDSIRGIYRVIELHERRKTDRKYIYDHVSDTMFPLSQEEAKNRGWIAQTLMDFGLDSSAVRRQIVSEYWVNVCAPGLTDQVMLLEAPYSVQDQVDDLGFAITGDPCYDYGADKRRIICLVDAIKDQQFAMNRQRSTKEDLMNRFVNPNPVVHENSVSERYFQTWLTQEIGAVRRWDGPAGAPEPRYEYPNVAALQIIDGENDMLMRFMQEIGGINQEVRGFRTESKQSGILFEKRAERSEGMMGPIVENTRTAMLQHWRFLHAMLCVHMKSERQIRILGPKNMTRFLRLNQMDPATGEYQNSMRDAFQKFDFIIDHDAYTRTEAQRHFANWMMWIQQFVTDPVVRLQLARVIVPMSDDSFKYEVQGEIEKAIMLINPQLLLSVEEMRAMVMGNPGLEQAVGGIEEGGLPPGIAPNTAFALPEAAALNAPQAVLSPEQQQLPFTPDMMARGE